MSLDRSLKVKSGLERHRNVLRRAERIVTLEDNEKWSESKNSVFGLVKVSHRKQVAAKKAAKVATEGATATVPGTAAAAPAGGKAASGGKAAGGAAPAGKAAPAAKSAGKK